MTGAPASRSCRHIRSCSLAAIILAQLPGTLVAAEAVHEYNPLVITASPIARPLLETGQSVTVISRADIEAMPVDNIPDLLDFIGGVDVRQRGGPGVQADIGIRGTAYEQTLIMVNGVRMSDPQTGHHNMNLPVPLAHIERIEILKGPGSAAYGPAATGGAINIITRRPEATEARGHLRGGSYDYLDIGAAGGTASGDNAHLLSASRRSSNGHISDEPTDFELSNASYTGYADFDDNTLTWGLGVDDRDFGAFKFYTADFPDQREETRTLLGYVSGDIRSGEWQIQPNIFWRNHEDWFRTMVGGTAFINEHETDVTGTRISARRAWTAGVTSVGASFADERIESNALGEHEREESSAWLEHQLFPVERLSVAVSVATVDYSDYGSEVLPGLSLSWQATEELTAFASGSRSTRTPSYTELFLNTGGNLGNPALQPELSDYYEAGTRWSRGNLMVNAALFYRATDDLIDWSRDPGDVQWQADNFDNHRTRGGEIEWTIRHSGNSALAMTRFSFTRLDTELETRSQEIKYALDYPRQQLTASMVFNWLPRLQHAIQTRYTERRDGRTVTLLGTQLGWQHNNIRYTLEGTNLLDEEYSEAGFAPQPGRWLIGGVQIDF